MFRLVSYRSDPTAPTWRAGVASQDALIDLAGYATAPSGGLVGGTYRSVRAFLGASPDEQVQILAWAARRLEAGEQVHSLDEVELGPPVPDPEKILCLGLGARRRIRVRYSAGSHLFCQISQQPGWADQPGQLAHSQSLHRLRRRTGRGDRETL